MTSTKPNQLAYAKNGKHHAFACIAVLLSTLGCFLAPPASAFESYVIAEHSSQALGTRLIEGGGRQATSLEWLLHSLVSGYAQNGVDGVVGGISAQLDASAQGAVGDIVDQTEGTSEISIHDVLGENPSGSILLLKPIAESEDLSQTLFMQTSAAYDDSRTTVNAGLGIRQLISDKKILLGLTAFYDHEFPYDHQRMSSGGEIRTTVGEVNANYYKELSGWKGPDNSEKAAGGYDIELGIALPYMPSAMLRAKTFAWNGEDGADDLKGNTFSLTGSIVPNLTFELGHTDFNSVEDEQFVKLSYALPFGGKGTTSDDGIVISSKAYELTSMVDKRLEKVRRENKIVKQKLNIGVTFTGY